MTYCNKISVETGASGTVVRDADMVDKGNWLFAG